MQDKQVKDLLKEMDEFSLDLAAIQQNFDKELVERRKRALEGIQKSYTDFTQVLKEETQNANRELSKLVEKEEEVLTQFYQPKFVEVYNREEELEQVERILEEQKGYAFEENLKNMNIEPIKKETPIVETPVEITQGKIKNYNIESALNVTLQDDELHEITLEALKKESKEMSIKPNAKVKNKPKKKKGYLQTAKYVVGASLILGIANAAITGTTLNHLPPKEITSEIGNEYEVSLKNSDIVEIRTNALNEYEETIYKPNTQNNWIRGEINNRLTDSHNWTNIIEQVHEKYEDPVVGFYMIYTKLDSECKNNDLKSILAEFNLYYGTNYTSLEDVLNEKGLKNYKDLAKYVGYALSIIEEQTEGRGL